MSASTDDAPLPERVPVIVSAKRFLAMPTRCRSRDGSLGVSWPNDRRVAELKPWLGHLALIALDFPKFRDGRAYSQARLLRESIGFRGTLRATGDVLRDQFTLPGARRLQFIRREEAGRCRRPSPKASSATACSISRAPTAALPALRRRLQSAAAAKPRETV